MLRMGETVRIKRLDFLKKHSPSFTTERPVTGVVAEIVPEADGSVTYGVVCDSDTTGITWYYGEDELEQGSLCWVSKEDNNE